jgi:hypothetical protein
MRFKEFLQEASHRTDISVEKAWELLEANCKDALKNFTRPLWRGTRRAREEAYLFHADANEEGRTSANTTNHYTIIMDKFLPYFGYPKRSKSIILASNGNLDYAKVFGQVYAIFPYDGIEIGVCQKHELWYTTPFKIGNDPTARGFEDWNIHFHSLGLSDNSWEDFKDSLEEKMQADGELMQWYGPLEKIQSVFQKAFDPESIHTELSDSASIRHVPGPRELWISGKCIGLSFDTWKQLKKEKGFE